MKKILLAILLAFTVLFATACNNVVQEDSSQSEDSDKKEIAEDTDAIEGASESTDENSSVEDATEEGESSLDASKVVPEDSVFDASKLSSGVSEYIENFDIRDNENMSKYAFELSEKLVSDIDTKVYKDYYVARGDVQIRAPYFKWNGESAKVQNKFVQSILDEIDFSGCLFYHLDYDAYIYNDILSVRIYLNSMYYGMEEPKLETLEAYNFDISGDEVVEISSNEMLTRLGVEKDELKSFVNHYIVSVVPQFVTSDDARQHLEETVTFALENLDRSLNEDKLFIYKNKNNRYYDFELAFDFKKQEDSSFRLRPTLAPTAFQMALLSKPKDAVGVVYIAREDEELPKQVYNGNPPSLVELSDKKSGKVPVYFTSYYNSDVSVDVSPIDIVSLDLNSGNMIFVNKPKWYFGVEDSKITDVYVHYTDLPEVMPYEVISLGGDVVHNEDNKYITNFSQVYIQDDMRFGCPLTYVFEDLICGTYNLTNDDTDRSIVFYEGGYYNISGDLSDKGIPTTGGKYTISGDYVTLFPSEKDIEKGVKGYYLLMKEQFDSLKLIYSEKEGIMNNEVLFELESDM